MHACLWYLCHKLVLLHRPLNSRVLGVFSLAASIYLDKYMGMRSVTSYPGRNSYVAEKRQYKVVKSVLQHRTETLHPVVEIDSVGVRRKITLVNPRSTWWVCHISKLVLKLVANMKGPRACGRSDAWVSTRY